MQVQVQVQDVGFGYSPFPHELSRDSGVSLQAKGLFAVYGSFVSVVDSTAWPSEAYICRLCGGINEKTFRKYKKELIDTGWISQQQRHRENGQYTTLLVTRYVHPSMNPFFLIKSTDDQKTDGGKTDDRKLVPQEQEPIPFIKKHTQTKEVCVSARAGERRERPSASAHAMGDNVVTDEQRKCIDWIVDQSRRRGVLRNESGLRSHLVRAAVRGQLVMDEYHAYSRLQERSDQAATAISNRIDEWRRDSEEEPLTPDFWAEQRKRLPALFVGGGGERRKGRGVDAQSETTGAKKRARVETAPKAGA